MQDADPEVEGRRLPLLWNVPQMAATSLEMYQTGSEQPMQTDPDFLGLQTQSGLNLTCRAQRLDG